MQTQNNEQSTGTQLVKRVRVVHRGQIVETDDAVVEGGRARWEVELERLIADLGPYEVGRTHVEVLSVAATDNAPESSERPSVESLRNTGDGDEPNTKEIAKARVEAQRETARAAGFAPPRVFKETGVVADEQRSRPVRQKWEETELLTAQLKTVIESIKNEERRDLDVCASDLRMRDDGSLTVSPGSEVYRDKPFGFESHAMLARVNGANKNEPATIEVTPQGFAGMCSRLGWGGGKYLIEKCWPELRALNLNRQMRQLYEREIETYTEKLREARRTGAELKFARGRLTLRTRNAEEGSRREREVFAVVTPSYTVFDSDVVCEGVLDALPDGARGNVTYDGRLVRINAVFNSTLNPKHWAEGEVLRAGLQCKTNDVGGGSLVGLGFVWFNACCNMAIFTRVGHEVFRIPHRATRKEVAKQFEYGLKRTLEQIGPFLKAWDYANDEDVVVRAAGTTTEDIEHMPTGVLLAGLFNGLLERKREFAVVRGRRKDLVPQLVDACHADESYAGRLFREDNRISRSLLCNATTLVAHRRERVTPWDEDSFQMAGGSLLFGRRAGQEPDPIPFVPFDAKGTKLESAHAEVFGTAAS